MAKESNVSFLIPGLSRLIFIFRCKIINCFLRDRMAFRGFQKQKPIFKFQVDFG